MSLQGTLRTLGIAEVLEFLAGRKATGRLEITSDSGYATYWVSGGEIVSVDYDFDRESGTDAAEATYYALAETEGHFHFDEDQRPENVDETEAIADVLSRTADAADGWSYVEEVIASPQHLLTRSETLDEAVTVQPDWWTALAAIDGGSTSQQLAKVLEMRALAASTMASEMVRAGLLQVGQPRVEPESASDPVADTTAGLAGDPVDDAETIEASEPDPGTHLDDAAEPAPEVETAYGDLHDGESAEPADPAGLHLFAGSSPEAAVDHESPLTEPDEDVATHLSVVDAIDPEPAQFGSEPEPETGWGDATTRWDEIDPTPASPALVWDAEAPAMPEPSAPDHGDPTSTSEPDMTQHPQPAADDWDDDEGWATDHSQPAAVASGSVEGFMTAPAAADVFGSAPAVDAAAMPPPPPDGADPSSDEYAGDDRSSVLKFLRRD